MILTFERGDPSRPKGHALAYVRDGSDPNTVYATYLVVPPISIDLAKYMPPMFAAKVSLADVESVSAIPLPPVPEKVSSVAFLHQLAESRGDDVVFLGTVDVSDPQVLLAHVADAAQEYLASYTLYLGNPQPVIDTELPLPDPVVVDSVDEVLYWFMNERDKLGELGKLVGKLRYALDGSDNDQAREAEGEMESLGRHLGEKYRVDEIMAAAQISGDKGRELSELHLVRCFKLCDEDFSAVEDLDSRILELEADDK